MGNGKGVSAGSFSNRHLCVWKWKEFKFRWRIIIYIWEDKTIHWMSTFEIPAKRSNYSSLKAYAKANVWFCRIQFKVMGIIEWWRRGYCCSTHSINGRRHSSHSKEVSGNAISLVQWLAFLLLKLINCTNTVDSWNKIKKT